MNPQPSTLRSLSRPHSDQPSIHLRIERLVLEGLPVSHHQGTFVQAAIETELTRLLGEGNLSALSAGARSYLWGGSIQLTHDSQPVHLGHQIAQAIHTGLGPAPKPFRAPKSNGGPVT